MRASATELANDSKAIVDAAMRGLDVEITRQGRTVAVLTNRPRASAEQARRMLAANPLTPTQRAELAAACAAAAEAFE